MFNLVCIRVEAHRFVLALAAFLATSPCYVWSQSEVREFRSRDGQQLFRGTLGELDGARVLLLLEDGQEKKLKVADLTKEDQLWLRNHSRIKRRLMKEQQELKDKIQSLAALQDSSEIVEACVELGRLGAAGRDAVPIVKTWIEQPISSEVAYHSILAFASISDRRQEDWDYLLESLQADNQVALIQAERNPVALLDRMSLYGERALPLLQTIAFQAEFTLVDPAGSEQIEFRKLDTVSGPDNSIRAQACLALGNIRKQESLDAVKKALNEANMAINRQIDVTTIEACLIALANLAMTDSIESIFKKHEKKHKSVVKQAREIYELKREEVKIRAANKRISSSRRFFDQRGKHVRAIFVSLNKEKVRLEDLEGNTIVLPLSSFTEVDQKWIREKAEELAAEASEKPAGEPTR